MKLSWSICLVLFFLPGKGFGATTNLLANPGAETGNISGWVAAGGAVPATDSGSFDPGINPHSGSFDFYGVASAEDTLTQNIALVGNQGITSAMIDTGTLLAKIDFFAQGLNQGSPSDSGRIILTYRDALSNIVGTSATPEIDSHNLSWTEFTNSYQIPTGTRSIDYTMDFLRHQGSDNDSFIDDNSLVVTSVPEPSSCLICVVGCAGLIHSRRRTARERNGSTQQ